MVSEGCIGALLRHEGECADAAYILFEADPKPLFAARRFAYGSGFDIERAGVPLHREHHLALRFRDLFAKLEEVVRLLAVQLFHHVPGAQTAPLERTGAPLLRHHVAHTRHDETVGVECDAYGRAAHIHESLLSRSDRRAARSRGKHADQHRKREHYPGKFSHKPIFCRERALLHGKNCIPAARDRKISLRKARII